MNHLSEHVGKDGHVLENGLSFIVTIKDVKNAYGNLRYLVTPKAGYGQTWINATRVRVLGGN
jgi:hypothetical protein